MPPLAGAREPNVSSQTPGATLHDVGERDRELAIAFLDVQLAEDESGHFQRANPSLALGEDVRFEGDSVFGGGLVYEETPIHISLFRSDEQTTQTTRAGMLARASQRRQHYTSGPIMSQQVQQVQQIQQIQQVTPQPNVAPEPHADEGGPQA